MGLVVGGILVTGLVVFRVGAGAWRLDYQQPLLASRLTVVPWDGERAVASGRVPDGFAAYQRRAAALHHVHIVAAHVGSAVPEYSRGITCQQG